MKILKKLFLPLSLFCFLIAFSSCNKEDNEIEFVGFGTVESFGTVINIDVKEGEEPLYLRGTMLNSMLLSDGQRVFVYGTIDKDNQTEESHVDELHYDKSIPDIKSKFCFQRLSK